MQKYPETSLGILGIIKTYLPNINSIETMHFLFYIYSIIYQLPFLLKLSGFPGYVFFFNTSGKVRLMSGIF